MQIIARYITKEILVTFAGVTGILLLIVLSNRFAVYLAKAATGELPVSLVFYIVSLYIPELLSYLIPLGLFIAILFAFGRLYVDSEMTVLSACGVSNHYIIELTVYIAALMMLITAGLTLWVVPEVALKREKALSEGESVGVVQSLLPQHFQTFGEGKLIFYLEDVESKSGRLSGIFIAERPTDIKNKEHGWTVITAKTAHVKPAEKDRDVYLVLEHGHRYQGLPGDANYSVVDFKEYGRAISSESGATKGDGLRDKGTFSLLASGSPEAAAELQWRLSLPLSVPILALIAVPLSRVRPRHGRFAKFLPALVIYIVYYNSFTICRRWVEADVLPSYLGVWWVHVLFLLTGLWLIAKDGGWRGRKS